MNIGWFCHGYSHTSFIARDGASNIRVPIIEKLLRRHHTIYWLGHKRVPEIEREHLVFIDAYKEFYNYYKKQKPKGKTVREICNDFTFTAPLPGLDVLFIEFSAMGIQSLLITAFIKYYFKSARIIIYDTDNYFSTIRLKLSYINVNTNDVLLLTPYDVKRTDNQVVMYYPYNEEKERAIKKGQGCVYIGNDYGRRDEMKRLLNHDFIDVYGDFNDALEDENFNKIKCAFKGACQPCEVHDIINKYLISVQLVKKDYMRIGLMTQRINEVLEAGTILLIDGRIKDANKVFTKPNYFVYDNNDILEKYRWAQGLNDAEYARIVQEQREMILKLSSYEKFIEVIENAR